MSASYFSMALANSACFVSKYLIIARAAGLDDAVRDRDRVDAVAVRALVRAAVLRARHVEPGNRERIKKARQNACARLKSLNFRPLGAGRKSRDWLGGSCRAWQNAGARVAVCPRARGHAAFARYTPADEDLSLILLNLLDDAGRDLGAGGRRKQLVVARAEVGGRAALERLEQLAGRRVVDLNLEALRLVSGDASGDAGRRGPRRQTRRAGSLRCWPRPWRACARPSGPRCERRWRTSGR